MKRRAKFLRSAYNDRSAWRAHVVTAPFYDRPITEITRREIQDWVFALFERRARQHRFAHGLAELDRTLSRMTVSRVVCLLRQSLREAVDEGILDNNPAEGIRLLPDRRTTEPWTFLTADEIRRLLVCDQIPRRSRRIYATAIYTGLRKGELWAFGSGGHRDSPQSRAGTPVFTRCSEKSTRRDVFFVATPCNPNKRCYSISIDGRERPTPGAVPGAKRRADMAHYSIGQIRDIGVAGVGQDGLEYVLELGDTVDYVDDGQGGYEPGCGGDRDWDDLRARLRSQGLRLADTGGQYRVERA